MLITSLEITLEQKITCILGFSNIRKKILKNAKKETKIEKINKTSDFKLFNFFIQKAKKWTKIRKSSTN